MSPGILGAAGRVLFCNNPSNDVMLVELDIVIWQCFSSMQIMAVQFPFTQFEIIFALNCAKV